MADYRRSGKIYIAYQGMDVKTIEIERELRKRVANEDAIKIIKDEDNNVIFAKVVNENYMQDRDPYQNGGIMTVNGYIQEELERVHNTETDPDRKHQITNYYYRNNGENLFKKMREENVHFSCVIYDSIINQLIAGVTEPTDKYTYLYYGYTKQNHEIMFSNVKEVLIPFCDEIKKMNNCTYMKNGEILTLDGKKEEVQLIEKNKHNGDFLIEGLNSLLVQITNDSVRKRIEENINNYLLSEDPKKRIEDYLLKELDLETQKQILTLIKKSIEENKIEENINQRLKETFDTKLKEYTDQIQVPVIHIIKLNDVVLGQTSGGFYHEKFEEILDQVQLDEPIMLIGPAGSGKNVTVKQVADALGLHMYYTNNASNEFKITGFIDAGGHYRETEFYRAFKNGGLFNLDEVDASDPTALIVINSALANGYMAFPHETIDRHKDFRIIAAANTWGKGSDMQYVGRNTLDGATLDRFDNIYMDYDRALEEALYPNEDVLTFMWSFRDAVEKTKVRHIVSTRGIGKVYKKEINNFPVEQTLRTNVVKNLGQDDVNTISQNMININHNNKYYEGLKRLQLKR